MLPEPEPRPALDWDARCDCAVIGAGYTGIMAAHRLAKRRPDWSILVLDEQQVGQGSAGRNSGFLMDLGHYTSAFGLEGNRNLVALSRFGQGMLESLVTEHDLGDAWSTPGRYHVAASGGGERKLAAFVRSLEAMGEPYATVTAEELAARIGTPYYRDAIEVRGGALVQPAALIRGLADCLPDNVTVHERTSVRGVREGTTPQVETESGTVTAHRVLVATNGAVQRLGFLKGRIIPLFTFASLTRPLTPDERGALGSQPEWGLVPEERMGTTMRRTQDDRLLLRSTVSYEGQGPCRPASIERARAIHQRSLAARYPSLAEVELEHTWTGLLGMTLNNTHVLGELAQGIYGATGYNGVGIAMGSALGTVAADHLLGEESEEQSLLSFLPKPSWLPGDPVLGVGLRAYTGMLQLMAGRER